MDTEIQVLINKIPIQTKAATFCLMKWYEYVTYSQEDGNFILLYYSYYNDYAEYITIALSESDFITFKMLSRVLQMGLNDRPDYIK